MSMSHEGHRKRMKDRFDSEGSFDNFAPHEILEMILYSTIPRGDTNAIGHELIHEFGNLAHVFEASPDELMKVNGIGERSAFLLSLIPHICAAYNQSKWTRNITLGSADMAGQYAINLFIGRHTEEFRIICLDSNRRVFYQGVVARGTINEVPAYPRLIVEEVLKRKAQYVMFAHNHPNGSSMPSTGDKIATQQIESALEAIDVRMLDHIIVAGQQYYSMAEGGLL